MTGASKWHKLQICTSMVQRAKRTVQIVYFVPTGLVLLGEVREPYRGIPDVGDVPLIWAILGHTATCLEACKMHDGKFLPHQYMHIPALATKQGRGRQYCAADDL